MASEMACQEFKETQWLEATSQHNQHLQTQLSLLSVAEEEMELTR
jgi:hypothetical protein